MKKALLLALSMAFLFTLSACSNGQASEPNDPTQSLEQTELPAEIPEDAEQTDRINEDEIAMENTTDITMTVGDTVITATLTSSETTLAFLATLPRTLTMQHYGGREYYGRMEAISENGETIADFENGDVTYYPAGPSFAIFFAGEDSSSQGGLIRMGKITSDLSVFETLGNSVEMRIEIAQ